MQTKTVAELRKLVPMGYFVHTSNEEHTGRELITITESFFGNNHKLEDLLNCVTTAVKTPSEIMQKAGIQLKRKRFFGLFERRATADEIYAFIRQRPFPKVAVEKLDGTKVYHVNTDHFWQEGDTVWLTVSQWNAVKPGVYPMVITKVVPYSGKSQDRDDVMNFYCEYIIPGTTETGIFYPSATGAFKIDRTYWTISTTNAEAVDLLDQRLEEQRQSLLNTIAKARENISK